MKRLALVGLLAGSLFLAGCSSSGTDTASSTTDAATPAASGAAGSSDDFAAYAQCMSDNGVDLSSMGGGSGGAPGGERPSDMPTDGQGTMPSGMPRDRPSDMPSGMPSGDPGGQGGMSAPDGVDADTWAAAQAACADLAPTGGQGMGGPNGGQGGGTSDEATTATYQVFWSCMADHDVTAPDSGEPTDLDTSDATVAAALETCERLLPAGTLSTQ